MHQRMMHPKKVRLVEINDYAAKRLPYALHDYPKLLTLRKHTQYGKLKYYIGQLEDLFTCSPEFRKKLIADAKQLFTTAQNEDAKSIEAKMEYVYLYLENFDDVFNVENARKCENDDEFWNVCFFAALGVVRYPGRGIGCEMEVKANVLNRQELSPSQLRLGLLINSGKLTGVKIVKHTTHAFCSKLQTIAIDLHSSFNRDLVNVVRGTGTSDLPVVFWTSAWVGAFAIKFDAIMSISQSSTLKRTRPPWKK